MYPNNENYPYNGNYGYYPPVDPAKIEKKAVRHSGNRIGAAFLISLGAVTLLSFIIVAVFSNTAYVLSPIFDLILQIVLSIVMFVPPFIILAKISHFRLGDLFAHKKIPVIDAFWFICFGLMVSMGANIIVGYWAQILEGSGCNINYGSLEIPNSPAGIALWIFTISVLPALIEEFALRVVVLGSLRRYGDTFAIFASALLFALMHGNMVQIPFAFILGVVFAYITVVTGSVIPAIIIHFINNLFSCVGEIANQYGTELVKLLINYGLFSLFIILGIIGCCILSEKSYFHKRLYKPNSIISQGRTFAAFYSSPCIIIATVIYLLEAVILLFPTGVNLI